MIYSKKTAAIVLILPLFFIFLISFILEKQFIYPIMHEGNVQVADKQNYITKIPIMETSIYGTKNLSVTSLPHVLKEDEQVSFKVQLSLPKAEEVYSLQLRGLNQPFILFIDGQQQDNAHQFGLGKTINFYAQQQVVTIELLVTPINERVGFLQTPIIATLDTMQRFVFKQFAATLIILCSFLIVTFYSFVIYAQKRFAFQLQISLYFFFLSCSFFVSSDGMLDMWLPASDSLPLQLKTVAGLLTVIPLYILITTLYERPLRTKLFMFLISIIIAAIFSLFVVQTHIYRTLELLLWLILIATLFIFTCILCYSFYKRKELSIKHLVLIQALVYLCAHLSLRLYYNIFGTDIQTILWMLMFIFNIFIYVVLHQRNLAQELNLSKKEVLQSKISFFNAQIKPHFIYNALSNIMALCYIDNMKAAHLLGKFSTYLRIIFENNDSNDAITLQKELSLIDAYVEIEQARFPNKITYRSDVDEALLPMFIPPLVIQPFVENAIRHGLFNQMQEGSVTVTITRQHHILLAIVEDTGIGIEADVLENIQRGTHQNQGIGVMNVKERLQLMPNSVVRIESTSGVGTRVELHIPIIDCQHGKKK